MNETGSPYATIGFEVSDGTAFSAATYTLTATVTPVNDAPTSTNDAITTAEDTPLVLALTDFGTYADVEATPIAAVRISALATDGQLQYDTTGTGTWAAVLVNDVISAADISAGRLRFAPDLNETGSPYATLGFEVSDGTAFSAATYTLTATVNTVPSAQSIPEDTTQAIAGISVGDAETNVNSLQLAVSNGILNVAAAGGAGVAGNGSGSVVITGTQAAINATVASLTHRGNLHYTGPDTLTVTATDAGGLTDVDTVAITITAVDDAPVNSVPAAQSTNEDAALVFSAGNGNLVSISDVDAGAASIQVQLTVTNGTLTLSGTAGLTLVAGGSGTATMTYTGTIASWNAAMAGMSYAPTANYNGAATLTIVTNDLGNTGSGGPLTDTDVVNITVNPVNDAPVALNDGYTVAEDSTLTVGWWDTDWSRRQQITFNNTNVGGFAAAETLSNFPVLLVLNSTNVDYSSTQDDGGDLRFFDADGTPLAYEVERWDETGNSYVWVKVPQIDIGATDSITMYYGNAAVADGEDQSAVWAGTGYRAVYHLDDATPTVEDATSTNYDGTATNGASGGQAGRIGLAYGFDATDDYINLGDDRSFLDGASAATLSAWVNLDDNDGLNPNIILSASINNGGAPSGTSRMAIELDPFGDVKFIVRSDDSAVTTVFTTGAPVTAGTWHYITGVVDVVTDQVAVYVDGVARPTAPGPYTLPEPRSRTVPRRTRR